MVRADKLREILEGPPLLADGDRSSGAGAPLEAPSRPAIENAAWRRSEQRHGSRPQSDAVEPRAAVASSH